jgi:hypothetical protein
MKHASCAACFVAAATLGAGLGCGGSGQLDSEESDALSAMKTESLPYFFLGNSFHGLPLTHVEHAQRSASLIYGDCTPTGGEQPSCVPPLEIQNTVCDSKTVNVTIFTDGKHPGFDTEAADELRAVNRAARDARPMVTFDQSLLCD